MTKCLLLTSVLGCFRGRASRWARMCWNIQANWPRRYLMPALVCTSMRRLLVGLCVQVWRHLRLVDDMVSDGPLWALGAMHFNRISINIMLEGLICFIQDSNIQLQSAHTL